MMKEVINIAGAGKMNNSSDERKLVTMNTNAYGLRALATVVFDIDSGQRLDALYPPSCGLGDDAKKSIAHLALPHSNNQDEGDTQFTVRFREAPDKDVFLYGFVLFRQQRDESRSRGYFQKALVLVSDRPYIDLYDRVLRVTGPLFFTAGAQVLQAVYDGIYGWPAPTFNIPLVLPLAGTYITCIIPQLIDYADLDAAFDIETSPPSPSDHFIVESDEMSLSDEYDDEGVDSSDDGGEDTNDGKEDRECEQEGHKTVNGAGGESDELLKRKRPAVPPSPSFGDLLISKRTHQATAFENVGLYSSFIGLEGSLWLLWQFAITGESFVILSPHARTCSQATLAFASLISPLQFQGDYRPYYTLYETDFDELTRRQNSSVSNPSEMTVIGTTNPFFMKALNRWPNALIFPFLEPSKAKDAQIAASDSDSSECISLRIKKKVDLDVFGPSERARVLRRCSSYLTPDATVLRQLVSPQEVYVTQTASIEEDPYVTINNAILRKHFRKLTKRFLEPFEQYFGIWKANGVRPNLYMSAEDFMKLFDLQSFLASINPRKLPRQIRSSKWKALYTGFVRSPHFEPWFNYRRERCVHHFAKTMRSLRVSISPSVLLKSAYGKELPRDQCEQLRKEIESALEAEKTRVPVDSEQVRVIETHLKAVKKRLKPKKKAQRK